MADFKIVSATLLDLRGVMRLEHLCFGDDAWPWIDVVGMLSWPGEIRYKAVEGKRTIGFVAGETDLLGEVSQIATIGVHPDFRGRGVGSALLEACESALPGRTLRLTVRSDNVPAIRMYEKFGYHAYARLENYYQHGKAGTAMEKVR
jgi:ribosomal protein S18 acetylase RimI-like enzyme